jgi:hypothetical protein
MQHTEISLFAELIEKYGIIKVALSLLLAGIAISFPILISWLKELTKRGEEKKLYVILSQLSDNVKRLSLQYVDSISREMAEILLETFYRKEYWNIYDYIRGVIEKNDIENDRTGIEERLRMEIKIAFKALTNHLTKFKYRNRMLCEFLAVGTWENEIYSTLVKAIFETKAPTHRKIVNIKAYLNTEFDNILFLTMQNINNFSHEFSTTDKE